MLALVFGIVLVALVLMLAILLQSGYSPGLAAPMSPQMSGKKKGTDEILERATWVLGALFVVLTLVASHFLT